MLLRIGSSGNLLALSNLISGQIRQSAKAVGGIDNASVATIQSSRYHFYDYLVTHSCKVCIEKMRRSEMNLDHLYYFKTLVETKSRSATAEKLAITPSTLSLAIAKLERELNTSLLDKKRGSVSLTTDGQVFYEYIDGPSFCRWRNKNSARTKRGEAVSKRNYHRNSFFGPGQRLVRNH